jgi:hypothetical protein
MDRRRTVFERIFGREIVGFITLLTLGFAVAAFPPASFGAPRETFSSPENASSALYAAARDGNDQALMRILQGGKELVSLEDKGADTLERERFVIKYQEMHRFVQEDARTTVLYIGAENWPFPVPLRSRNGDWYFDSDAGAKEVLFRLIGQNEKDAIDASHYLVVAEGQYRATLHSDDTNSHYAARLVSTQGKQDGLYYGPDSPIPAALADAGITDFESQGNTASPYSGYYFRVLTQQGKQADGGVRSYFSNGEMIGGFAFVAYPATYGKTGVMTFIVGQDDVVYERDLGPETGKIASEMTTFNPGPNWQPVGD